MSEYDEHELDPAFDANYGGGMESFGESLDAGLGGGGGGGLGDELAMADSMNGMNLGDSLGAELEFGHSADLSQELEALNTSTPNRVRAGSQKPAMGTPTRTPRKASGMGSLADEIPSQDDEYHDLGESLEADVGGSTAAAGGSFLVLDEAAEEAKVSRIEAQQEAIRKELEDTLNMTQVFLAKLREQRSASNSAKAGAIGEDASLEASAASVLRLLQDLAAEREGQVRELREMGIAFSRPDLEWQAALAEAANIEDEADQSIQGAQFEADNAEDALGFSEAASAAEDPDASLISNTSLHGSSDVFSEGPRRAVLPGSPAPRGVGGSSAPGSPSLTRKTAASHMHELRACTDSLISSLETMNEHAQVSKASMNDASRKLRSLRVVLTQWREETDGVERSRAWIEQWEAAPSKKSIASEEKRPQDVRLWTQQQMERFEKLLADAEVRAKELLKPIDLPASFDAHLTTVP